MLFGQYFQTSWPKWLNFFFGDFQKRFGLWPKINRDSYWFLNVDIRHETKQRLPGRGSCRSWGLWSRPDLTLQHSRLWLSYLQSVAVSDWVKAKQSPKRCNCRLRRKNAEQSAAKICMKPRNGRYSILTKHRARYAQAAPDVTHSDKLSRPGLWSRSPSNFGWLELEPKAFRWRSRSPKFGFRFHNPSLSWVCIDHGF